MSLTTNVTTVKGLRILCVAEVRGKLSLLNDLAKEHNADVILHSGNFGFFDSESVKRIPVKTLKHIVAFSPLVDQDKVSTESTSDLKSLGADSLSELPQFLNGTMKLKVPVYTIYGASEDLAVIEKFKSGTYEVSNLNIIDETTTFKLDTVNSDLKIRLFGIGGNVLLHRFFDNGDGTSTIAGTYGLMWTTALQVGQLIQTVHDCFDESEVRIFVSHPCPSREGLLSQLALTLRSDFTISSGLHFIYSSSFNEYTTAPTFDSFRGKLASARASFMDVWQTVEGQISPLVEKDPKQKALLDTCLEVFKAMPSHSTDASKQTNEYLLAAYKSTWNFNLCDVQSGVTILNVVNGRFSWESKSSGFDFNFRTEKGASAAQTQPQLPANGSSAAAATTSNATAGASATTEAASGATEGNGSSKSYDTQSPGLWISNGAVNETELKSFFAPEDRELITSHLFRSTHGPHSKQFALVYFNSDEEAKGAMDRIDKEKAGTVRIITPQYQRRRQPWNRSDRGGRGSGMSSRARGGNRFRQSANANANASTTTTASSSSNN